MSHACLWHLLSTPRLRLQSGQIDRFFLRPRALSSTIEDRCQSCRVESFVVWSKQITITCRYFLRPPPLKTTYVTRLWCLSFCPYVCLSVIGIRGQRAYKNCGYFIFVRNNYHAACHMQTTFFLLSCSYTNLQKNGGNLCSIWNTMRYHIQFY